MVLQKLMEKKVIGVFTERDVMNKVVGKELNTHKTLVKDIMTPNPRVANETDDLIDWLRIMSNERFRRLPVVDGNGHITASLKLYQNCGTWLPFRLITYMGLGM